MAELDTEKSVTGGSHRLVVRNGLVADGTGAPLREVDVLVEGDRIASVAPRGALDRVDGSVLNASGLVVAPGFVDAHSHADNAPFLPGDDTTKILQGVTTEVVGNCGFSLAPVVPDRAGMLADLSARLFPPVPWAWTSWGSFVDAADQCGYVTNAVPLVGHNSLRIAAMGMDGGPAGPDVVRAMCYLLDEALEAGAFGMSSGLIYPPGMFAARDELEALAARLPAGRVYATHMRDEGAGLLDSVAEAIGLASRAGCEVEVSHLKVTGPANWGLVGEALTRLDEARRAGIPVGQDVYPYEASSTMLSSCLPPWFQAGGEEAVLGRLSDAALRDRLGDDLGREEPDWASRTIVAGTASGRHEGRSVEEIAAESGGDPVDALVEVLRAERLRATMVHFSMSEADVEAVLSDPATIVGSDGLPPGSGGRPHPRLFGTFPRVLGRYVRERRLLGLPEAVAKMTSRPADKFGVRDRGRIREGALADLVGFDPEVVSDVGDYRDPVHPPVGIGWVVQGGHLVVDNGRWLGRRRGRRLVPGA